MKIRDFHVNFYLKEFAKSCRNVRVVVAFASKCLSEALFELVALIFSRIFLMLLFQFLHNQVECLFFIWLDIQLVIGVLSNFITKAFIDKILCDFIF